jgi:DNA-binding transcriptional LysR family regulator
MSRPPAGRVRTVPCTGNGDQLSDFQRLRSQIADLSGVRRGHVAIAASQAFAHGLIPDAIATYRSLHPLDSFTILAHDHIHAVTAVTSFIDQLSGTLHSQYGNRPVDPEH